ncbi:zinc finger protein 91-like [Astyanax mexicanus]|uniref:Zinc finger protein 91-like n=1 Tax=Astyanax mexicanus TaxID=7994 RepID=A0A8B9JUW0_ASTMX|nr:zinc finger protein 91-like [Astyanax mexicanus]
MAAVYSAEEGSLLQTSAENSSTENREDAPQEQSPGSGSGEGDSGLEETGVDGELPAGVPAEEAGQHGGEEPQGVAVPLIKIKEEQIEENEYITVRLNESGEDSEEQTVRGENMEEDWPFRCEDCSEAFRDKEAYLEHSREHTHDGPIVCLDTDSEWDDLLVSTDGGRQTLCCALCGRTFSSSKEFFTHQLEHHNQDNEQQSISDTGQSSVKDPTNHQQSHKQPAESVSHEVDHLKKKQVECTTKAEKTEKMISDDQDPAQTEHTADTSSEQVEESEKKQFDCLCGRSFRTLCGLGTHQRFSTTCTEVGKVKSEQKRPYDCSECGKSFLTPLALSCHQHWHKRRAKLRGTGQTFTCKECGRVFTSLTFYDKHQRLAHSNEEAAKSFHSQVVQLQKKAFECEECGLRFSRASALQSHQLCHTDAFNDIVEKSSKTSQPAEHTPSSFQRKQVKAEHFAVGAVVYSTDALQADVLERELNSSDEDISVNDRVRSYNGFEIVSVTESSDSGSDCNSEQDLNLELVCESDQDEREDFSLNLSQQADAVPSEPVNPQMNVKIVQVGYEHFKEAFVNAGLGRSPPLDGKKYDCPHCDRTFVKAVALRCHLLWHRGAMGKKPRIRRNVVKKPIRKIECEICGHESFSKAAHYFHLGKHEDRQPYKSISYQLENLQKNSFKCELCEMQFSRLSALNSHQQHHDILKKKPYACLECNKRYAHAGGLYSHQKVCSGKEGHEKKMENFNPTKTLLGPKVHHCKKCGKGFWSMGAFIHHKQYQPQCAGVGTGSSDGPRQPEGERVRRKRRGRKRGVVHRNVDPEPKEEYKCAVCGKSYRMLGCFLKHQLIHDASNNLPPVKSFDYQLGQLKKNSYSCPDCGKLFSRAMALQFHMKCHGYETGLPIEATNSSHSSNGPQCQTCLAFFTSESALETHQKHCVKPKTEPEKPAEESQGNQSNQLNVVQENDPNVQIQKNSQNEAETTVSETPDSADLTHKCEDCGKAFSVVGALHFHRRIHMKGRPFESSEWQNVPQEKSGEQAGKFPFTCQECGRNFSTNAALGTHARWHKDKRMARCFSKNSSNMSRKNKGVGNYACNVCGKRFFYLCVLRRHQKYHPPVDQTQTDNEFRRSNPTEVANISSESGFACADCDVTFPSESLLASHISSHHSSDPDLSVDAKKLMLKTESKNFSAQISGQPIKSFADDDEDDYGGVGADCDDDDSPTFQMIPVKGNRLRIKYQCTLCRKSFSNMRGLRAHNWQKHRRVRAGRPPASTEVDVKPLACSRCGRRYTSLGALFNHERACTSCADAPKPLHKTVKPLVAERPVSPPHSPVIDPTTKCFYKCYKCGKAFPTEDQLHAHKEAARTRPHSCALCCRGFWTESQLQQHLAWHDEVRRRLPTELRYRFNTSSAFGSSAKPQASACSSGAKPLSQVRPPTNAVVSQSSKSRKCSRCDETFSSPLALQKHQAVHKNEEPYHCSLCPKTFDDIRDLIDHHQECLGDKELRDSSLSAPSKASKNSDSLTCIECGSSFDQETDLHQHYIEHAQGVC